MSNRISLLVNVDKLIFRLKKDDLYSYIGPDTKKINSLERINKIINSFKEINKIENPPLLEFRNGGLGVIDGRHRIIAVKLLGYSSILINVPYNQLELFTKLT